MEPRVTVIGEKFIVSADPGDFCAEHPDGSGGFCKLGDVVEATGYIPGPGRARLPSFYYFNPSGHIMRFELVEPYAESTDSNDAKLRRLLEVLAAR